MSADGDDIVGVLKDLMELAASERAFYFIDDSPEDHWLHLEGDDPVHMTKHEWRLYGVMDAEERGRWWRWRRRA